MTHNMGRPPCVHRGQWGVWLGLYQFILHPQFFVILIHTYVNDFASADSFNQDLVAYILQVPDCPCTDEWTVPISCWEVDGHGRNGASSVCLPASYPKKSGDWGILVCRKLSLKWGMLCSIFVQNAWEIVSLAHKPSQVNQFLSNACDLTAVQSMWIQLDLWEANVRGQISDFKLVAPQWAYACLEWSPWRW